MKGSNHYIFIQAIILGFEILQYSFDEDHLKKLIIQS